MAITLSLGYDHEKPYGEFANQPKWKEFRRRQMDFLIQMHGSLNQDDLPRTFFILGEFLERALDDYTEAQLREIHQIGNHLVEIQQHSYSHPTIRKISGREDKDPITPQEFIADVQKASWVLERLLGVKPTGLRTPIGYNRDLSDLPEIVDGLQTLGIKYVSSCLMGTKPFEGELTRERQPHIYQDTGNSGIVEIPTHGWQDSFFVFPEEKTLAIAGRAAPRSPEEIFNQYRELFTPTNRMAEDGTEVHIALCLHPWAVMEWDPQLEITRKLADTARRQGIEIISYSEVAKRVLKQQR